MQFSLLTQQICVRHEVANLLFSLPTSFQYSLGYLELCTAVHRRIRDLVQNSNMSSMNDIKKTVPGGVGLIFVIII